jgi:hypothetical protein
MSYEKGSQTEFFWRLDKPENGHRYAFPAICRIQRHD